MLDGDRVEDGPDRRSVVGGRLAIGAPGRPQLAGDPDHLGPDRDVLALGAFEDPGRAQVGVLEGMAHLRREQLRAEATLALGARQDDVAEMDLQVGEGPSGRLRGRPEAIQQGGDLRVGGGRRLTRSHGVVDELDDPGQLLEGRLGVEARDGTAGQRPEIRASRRDDHRDPLEASGRGGEPVGRRSELAGEEREDPGAEEVDPLERVPGLLAQLRLAEPERVELHQDQVAVDPFLGAQVGVGEAAQLRRPAIGEGQALEPAGLGQVRPFGVVGVHPGGGGVDGVESEELGQECVDGRAEGRRVVHRPSVANDPFSETGTPGSDRRPWTTLDCRGDRSGDGLAHLPDARG